jgi:outer membrane scaffolding protein for murein synthesis (MipA/OmpV family)
MHLCSLFPLRAALPLALALAAPLAFAQLFDAVRLAPLPPGQDGGRVGAAVVAGTQYRGSDERRTLVVPAIDYQWHNGWFAGVSNGIGYNASRRPEYQYGARLTADLGRDEGRSTVLRGMGSIDAQPELGLFFNRLWGASGGVTSSLRQGSGNQRDGLVLDLGGYYSASVGARSRVSLGLGTQWANAAYMQEYFGVTAAQSARTGYAVASPGAAWSNVSMSLGFIHRLDERTSLVAGLTRISLQGAARDSVLVRESASTTGVLAVTYAF